MTSVYYADADHMRFSRSPVLKVAKMGNASANNEGHKKGKNNKIVEELEKVKKNTCGSCGFGLWIAVGVVVSITVIVTGIGEIGTTVYAAKYTLLYTSALTGQLVAYIVLALSSAFALSIAVYALFGLFQKKKRPLHIAGLVLVTIAVVQAVTSGLSANLTSKEKEALAMSLNTTFRLAVHNAKDLEYWATISSDLKCCGVSGPSDYRTTIPSSFPPDVPIFCCPNFNISEPEVVQKAEREICKTLGLYHTVGCDVKVRNFAEILAAMSTIVTIVFVVLEVVLALHIYITYKVSEKREKKKEAKNTTVEAGTSCTK
ncbi:uncharacterized protein LOC128683797 [Plodia interpunctella]|uniref:uncharacterized protein LOC128683797 n=1 Tax=Plodia interpunctella TaxID=58824 RepID=UPI0023677A3F|nr:uncharacterized protein LOC128683797 [Plodia interpunctella]